jgi:hypothetical protein
MMEEIKVSLNSFTTSQLPVICSFESRKPASDEIIKLVFSKLSIDSKGKLCNVFYLSEPLQYSGKAKIFYAQSSMRFDLAGWDFVENYIIVKKGVS